MISKTYKNYFDPYEENESEKYQENYPWKKVDNLISIDKAIKYIQEYPINSFIEIFKDNYEIEYEEIKGKGQKSIDKALYEIKKLENKNPTDKRTTKNTNTNINANIEVMQPFNEPENNFLCSKRKEPSLPSLNGKNNENSLKTKTKKEKNENKNDRRSIPYIKKFHRLINIYFKYLIEEKFVDLSVFDKTNGPNGLYLSAEFTQKNFKNHSKKFDQKITNFIKKNKVEKLMKRNDKKILEILDLTVKQLIDKFLEYILKNSEYFKENEIIKKVNDNFIRVRKYPLIDFEKKEFAYYKYFPFE